MSQDFHSPVPPNSPATSDVDDQPFHIRGPGSGMESWLEFQDGGPHEDHSPSCSKTAGVLTRGEGAFWGNTMADGDLPVLPPLGPSTVSPVETDMGPSSRGRTVFGPHLPQGPQRTANPVPSSSIGFTREETHEEEEDFGLAALMPEVDQAVTTLAEEDTELPGDGSQVCGLQNLGNTCFINAGLQCMFYTESFVQDLAYGAMSVPSNPGSPMDAPLTKEFLSLLRRVRSCERRVIYPKRFKAALGSRYPQYKDYRQHDSQEFLTLLLDSIHECFVLKETTRSTQSGLSSPESLESTVSVGSLRNRPIPEEIIYLGRDSDRAANNNAVVPNGSAGTSVSGEASTESEGKVEETVVPNIIQDFLKEHKHSNVNLSMEEEVRNNVIKYNSDKFPRTEHHTDLRSTGIPQVENYFYQANNEALKNAFLAARKARDFGGIGAAGENPDDTPHASESKLGCARNFGCSDWSKEAKGKKMEGGVSIASTNQLKPECMEVDESDGNGLKRDAGDETLWFCADGGEDGPPERPVAEASNWEAAGENSSCGRNGKRQKLEIVQNDLTFDGPTTTLPANHGPATALPANHGPTLPAKSEEPEKSLPRRTTRSGSVDNRWPSSSQGLIKRTRSASGSADTKTGPRFFPPTAASTAAVRPSDRDEALLTEEAWAAHSEGNRTVVSDNFQGQFRSTVVCAECQFMSVTFEPFTLLSLPLPRATEMVLDVVFVPLPPFDEALSPPPACLQPSRHALSLPAQGNVQALKVALLDSLERYHKSLLESALSQSQRSSGSRRLLISTPNASSLFDGGFTNTWHQPQVESSSPPITKQDSGDGPAPFRLPSNPLGGENRELRIAEVFDNHVSKVLEDMLPLSHLHSSRDIYAFVYSQRALGVTLGGAGGVPVPLSPSVAPGCLEMEGWESCLICLDTQESDCLKVHSATCQHIICDTCLENYITEFTDQSTGTFSCPFCHQDCVPGQDFQSFEKPGSSGLKAFALSVVFRNDITGRELANNEQRTTLFGSPRVLHVMELVSLVTLSDTVNAILPLDLKDQFDLLLVDGQGLKCSRCMFAQHCTGCPVEESLSPMPGGSHLGEQPQEQQPKSQEETADVDGLMVRFKPGDSVCIRFKDLKDETLASLSHVEAVPSALSPSAHPSPFAPANSAKRLCLRECLEAFSAREQLSASLGNGWFCSSCRLYKPATKTLSIWRLPRNLMVHLKRFSFHDNSSSKLGIPVDFPRGQDLLDMSPYTSGPSEAQPGASTQYKLYATVCHLGGKCRPK